MLRISCLLHPLLLLNPVHCSLGSCGLRCSLPRRDSALLGVWVLRVGSSVRLLEDVNRPLEALGARAAGLYGGGVLESETNQVVLEGRGPHLDLRYGLEDLRCQVPLLLVTGPVLRFQDEGAPGPQALQAALEQAADALVAMGKVQPFGDGQAEHQVEPLRLHGWGPSQWALQDVLCPELNRAAALDLAVCQRIPAVVGCIHEVCIQVNTNDPPCTMMYSKC
mmetsp:Transcript_108847/g.318483  ORF Transcript_108847/g.318483 Transcript_108847/m.318483 type:complete len:222 (-) Transcript_108847:507-1172(-)